MQHKQNTLYILYQTYHFQQNYWFDATSILHNISRKPINDFKIYLTLTKYRINQKCMYNWKPYLKLNNNFIQWKITKQNEIFIY